MSLTLPGIIVNMMENEAAYQAHELDCALDDIRNGRIDDILIRRIENARDSLRIRSDMKS